MLFPGLGEGENKGPIWGLITAGILFFLMWLWFSLTAATIAMLAMWLLMVMPLYSYPHKWGWNSSETLVFMFLGFISAGYVVVYTSRHNRNRPAEDPNDYYARAKKLKRRASRSARRA